MGRYQLAFVLFYLLCLVPGIKTTETVTFNTTSGKLVHVLEHDVLIARKSNITFSVKGCGDLHIIFSDLARIAEGEGGNYFVILMSKSMTTIEDSCMTCERVINIFKSYLNCDQFVDFWTRWDSKGFFELGTGNKVGESSLLNVTGVMKAYPIYNLAVTSTNGQAQWKFKKDYLRPQFYQPIPNGHTVVTMSDLDPPGSDVIQIMIRPENKSVTFSIDKNSAKMFYLEKDIIKLKEELDINYSLFHIIQVRSDNGLVTSMTVKVELTLPLNDKNLRAPEVNVKRRITVPEELPLGTVIDWNLTTTDPDKNDKVSFSLSGSLAEFFSVSPRGQLQIKKVIDRDSVPQTTLESPLSVTVSDLKPHDVTVKISVTITDINDNVPTFDNDLYIVSVQENSTSDASILVISCRDLDSGLNSRFELTIFGPHADNYYLKQTSKQTSFELYVRAGVLDYEKPQPHIETLVIHAVDAPQQGVSLTGTAAVIIKILPKDEFPPLWVSPVPNTGGRFTEVTLPEGTPTGNLVTIFKIEDLDQGLNNISYHIRKDENGETSSVFTLDSRSGDLTTLVPLTNKDVDRHHDLVVTATSNSRTLKGFLRISLLNPNIVLPLFSNDIYFIRDPRSPDDTNSLLTFHVTIPGTDLQPRVEMDDNGKSVFKLQQRNTTWKLILKSDVISGNIDFPLVVVLRAFHPDESSVTSYAKMLIQGQVGMCKPPQQTTLTSSPSSKSTFTSTYASTSTSTEVTSVSMPVNVNSQCPIPDTTLPRVLLIITLFESAGLVLIIARYRMSSETKPDEEHDDTTSTKKRQGKRPTREDTIANSIGNVSRQRGPTMSPTPNEQKTTNSEISVRLKSNQGQLLKVLDLENDPSLSCNLEHGGHDVIGSTTGAAPDLVDPVEERAPDRRRSDSSINSCEMPRGDGVPTPSAKGLMKSVSVPHGKTSGFESTGEQTNFAEGPPAGSPVLEDLD